MKGENIEYKNCKTNTLSEDFSLKLKKKNFSQVQDLN